MRPACLSKAAEVLWRDQATQDGTEVIVFRTLLQETHFLSCITQRIPKYGDYLKELNHFKVGEMAQRVRQLLPSLMTRVQSSGPTYTTERTGSIGDTGSPRTPTE